SNFFLLDKASPPFHKIPSDGLNWSLPVISFLKTILDVRHKLAEAVPPQHRRFIDRISAHYFPIQIELRRISDFYLNKISNPAILLAGVDKHLIVHIHRIELGSTDEVSVFFLINHYLESSADLVLVE